MDAEDVQSILQLPSTPGGYIEFNTLQIIDDINIPTTHWNSTNIPEPITVSYPKWGQGGASQRTTNTPIENFTLRNFTNAE